MDIIQENLNNLFLLWKTAAIKFHSYTLLDEIDNAYIKETQWPCRTWSTKTLAKQDYQNIKQNVEAFGHGILSYFSVINGVFSPSNFFELKFEQSGMSLLLQEKFEEKVTLDLEKVTNLKHADIWSDAFYQAFNYSIAPEVIDNTKEDIAYFIVKHNGEIVGTIIKFITGTTCGIHSLGITPQHRKKGYAKNIMKKVLNDLDRDKIKLVTLQASAAAKDMYAGLGFSYDFKMENYFIK